MPIWPVAGATQSGLEGKSILRSQRGKEAGTGRKIPSGVVLCVVDAGSKSCGEQDPGGVNFAVLDSRMPWVGGSVKGKAISLGTGRRPREGRPGSLLKGIQTWEGVGEEDVVPG